MNSHEYQRRGNWFFIGANLMIIPHGLVTGSTGLALWATITLILLVLVEAYAYRGKK